MPYKDIEKKRESGRNYQRKAYALNPERFNKHCREWRKRNKQYNIDWRKEHPWVSVYSSANIDVNLINNTDLEELSLI